MAVDFLPVTAESLRQRFARMDDDALKRFGRAAAYMYTPAANLGKPPRDVFLLQLREARAEWQRRKGNPPD
jgi:hypothetical protein